MLLLGACLLVAAWKVGWLAAMGLLGLATGAGVAHLREATCAARWDSGPHAALVAVDDRPSRRGVTTGVVLSAPEGCGGSIPLRFDSAAAVRGGSRILAAGVFRAPAVLRVRRARVLTGARRARFVIRDAVGARVERLYGARAPVVEALILGRREDLDPELRRQFAAAGLAHFLVIAGLHVGIMAGWCALLLRLLVPRRLVILGSALFAWGYVFLLGCPAPATRAAAFITIAAVSRLRQRHPPSGAVLAVGFLIVLAVDPTAVTSAGAWLSAAAVWGIGAAIRALPPTPRPSVVKRLLTSSLGATVATAPITAYVFGAAAPIGVVANLVVIPLAGLAVPAVFLSLVCGGWVASGAGIALAAVERAAHFAAGVPGGHVEGEPGIAFAIPWAALLIVLLWMRHRRPAWAVARRRGLLAIAAGAWVFAVLPFLPSSHAAGIEIDVLDVGQGDAIAIRSPRGRWALIDGGPRTPVRDAGREVVLPFFRREGVRRLDLLVATHADADHLGGVPAVIRSLDPELMLESGQPVGTALFLEHLAALDAQGVAWRSARAGDTLLVDSMTLAVLHPTQEWLDRHSETNENSVVVRLTYGLFDALFTGDMGWPAESALAPVVPPTAVLKIGHHGSAGSTSKRWLDAVRPKVAVISVGENHYGHPSPAVLARLAADSVLVRRTDRGGTVTIGSDGRYFWVEQGGPTTLGERLRCLRASWSRSNDSSSSTSTCTAARRVSFPLSSTTSRSPPR